MMMDVSMFEDSKPDTDELEREIGKEVSGGLSAVYSSS